MVEMFKRSKFFLAVATKMDYDEGFVFTENNIVQYLAELEEYINTLIVFTAFKRDDGNAAIAAIPFESLNQKDFKKKETAVENPPEHTFGAQLMQSDNVDQHGNEEAGDQVFYTDKHLYKNFIRLWHGKQEKEGQMYNNKDEGQSPNR
jgi:hypothetical protein